MKELIVLGISILSFALFAAEEKFSMNFKEFRGEFFEIMK